MLNNGMENVLTNLELRTAEYNKLPDNLKEFFEPIFTDHFAIFPQALLEIPIKASCPKNGIILDCFSGAATTLVVAKKLQRNWIGIELNPAYIEIGYKRLALVPEPMV